MLVLSRRVGEEVVIGDEVRVMVLGVRGDKVRLGITGPPSIRVDRLEVHLRRDEADHLQSGLARPIAVAATV